MHEFINYIINTVWNLWYTWIFFMMVLESSFIPFPSEVAMIPAWFLVFKWEINFSLALLVWTFWAIIWATINYFIAYKLWEKIILKLIKKYWKYFLIKEEHYKKSENYFLKHWSITIFLARFIPAIRQLISLPAGAFQMNYKKFFIYTWIWALIWNLILMIIWYIAGQNQELIKQYSQKALILVLIFSLIVIFFYIRNNKRTTKG
jgi:membrane protein DedA with SNARE-associated domain